MKAVLTADAFATGRQILLPFDTYSIAKIRHVVNILPPDSPFCTKIFTLFVIFAQFSCTALAMPGDMRYNTIVI